MGVHVQKVSAQRSGGTKVPPSLDRDLGEPQPRAKRTKRDVVSNSLVGVTGEALRLLATATGPYPFSIYTVVWAHFCKYWRVRVDCTRGGNYVPRSSMKDPSSVPRVIQRQNSREWCPTLRKSNSHRRWGALGVL